MAIKFGAALGEVVKSYRIGSTDSPLVCQDKITPYITNVTLTTTERTTICFDVTQVLKNLGYEFCFDTITWRITSRNDVVWVGKLGASSAWPAGSVLNKVGCQEGIFQSYHEVAITVRGRGNVFAIDLDTIISLMNTIGSGNWLYQEAYQHILNAKNSEGGLKIMDEDRDIPLNDWERTSATFRGYSTLDRGMATSTWEYDGTLNMDRGTGDLSKDKTYYDDTDIPLFENVVSYLKDLAGL